MAAYISRSMLVCVYVVLFGSRQRGGGVEIHFVVYVVLLSLSPFLPCSYRQWYLRNMGQDGPASMQDN
jgi:hypothetical protein